MKKKTWEMLGLEWQPSADMDGRMFSLIKSTVRSSDYYGVCEICEKHVSETFTSTDYKVVAIKEVGFEETVLVHMGTQFGHEKCLRVGNTSEASRSLAGV